MIEFVWVFGYGSLLDEASVQRTMPNAACHSCALLFGYQRIYSLVSLTELRNGLGAEPKLATLAIVPVGETSKEGRGSAGREQDGAHRDAAKPVHTSSVLGAVFRIPAAELEGFFEREQRYRIERVKVTLRGTGEVLEGVFTAVESTDEEYRRKVPRDEDYHERVGQHYAGKLWGRQDILPVPEYVNFVRRAAARIGPDALENYLDGTLLADRTTPLR